MRSLSLALAAVCLAACASDPQPDLRGLYERAAQWHGPERNPVVVLPGVLGSKLRDGPSAQIVWGAFGGGSIDPSTRDGARLIALEMEAGQPLSALRDEVVPDGALDTLRVELWGFLPIGLSAYAEVLATLGVGGYVDEDLGLAGAVDYGTDHYTCFQFDYDWRRDVVESAAALAVFLREKREEVRLRREQEEGRAVAPEEVRFDLVAHSMGGLLAMYFLRYGAAELDSLGVEPEPSWAGAELVDRAILIGPPLSGSVYALRDLVQGVRFSPLLPRYEPAVLGTMPGLYQLLPRARHGGLRQAGADLERLDPHEPATWIERGWGLADPEQARVLADLLPEVAQPAERRAIALDHLEKCLGRARSFAHALDVPSEPPAGLELFLIAGDALPTASELVWEEDARELRVGREEPGDGTVTRASALADERAGGAWSHALVSPHVWEQVLFLFSGHLELTRDPVFTDNVLYLLLEDPRRSASSRR